MAMTDMASMASMSMPSATAIGSTAAATSAAMSMGGMDMGDGGCKISMLWNWYTIDACFLARTWRIRTTGAFAGSCIGVILLVMVLEALRRASKEYDGFIIRKRRQTTSTGAQILASNSVSSTKDLTTINEAPLPAGSVSFRPTFLEQAIRAALHTIQFAVAYFVMLLAMYYNGYIIICIFIGAYLGAFVFSWTSLVVGDEEREITYCCG